jgi:hypothetical protein
VHDEVRAARANTSLLHFGDELHHQPADIFVDRLSGPDRLLKRSRHLDQVCGPDWIDRLVHSPEHLVEASTSFRSKAKSERRSWRVRQLANRLKPENTKILGHLPRQPQERDRQLFDGPHDFAARDDDGIAVDGTDTGMCSTPGVGDRNPGCKLSGVKQVDDTGDHRKLATL